MRIDSLFCCAFAVLSIGPICFQAAAQSEKPPTTRVQIVNACSVPVVSLEINGEMLYPEFPQGQRTSGGAVPRLKARYKITDLASKGSGEETFSYEPDTFNTLVLLGDFTTTDPANNLPQPGEAASETGKHKPNVHFRLIHNTPLEEGTKPRYRFINAVPRETMVLANKETLPGAELLLEGQPPVFTYEAKFGSQSISVAINQDQLIRNCTIIFYKTGKGIAFVRAFENSPISENDRAAQE